MRRRAVRGAVAVIAVGGITAGVMLAPGYDQRTVAPDDAAVWAMQSGDGRRFARVNTAVGELDTVKVVANPSDITSFGGTVLVFANNLGTVSALPAGQVHDLEDTADPASTATPPGTTGISYSGDVVGYVTEDGQVLAGRISDGTAVKPRTIDPYADVTVAKGEQRQQFRADAVAVAADGTVVAYSATDQQVLVATVDDGSVKDVVPVAGGPTGDVQLTTVGSTWVLLGEDSGSLWVAGRSDPVTTDLAADPVLQRPSGSGSTAYVADAAGLVSVSLDDGVVARVFSGAEASLGTPAAPAVADGEVTAAWLPTGQGPGTLWTTAGSTTALDYGGATLDDTVAPVLRSNGVRTVLNDTVSGWVWDVNGGGLLPSSQAWDTQDQTVVEAVVEDSTKPVTDPRPPVALPDSFGVRQGRQVLLPVLLNDHDANDDPLTIAPASITQPDPSFGTVATADDGQSMVVDVAAGATGSATFSYAVTDGTTKGGLTSDTVTVTLTVHPDGVNEPPVWCGATDCLATWPSAQLAPGGTTTAEVLSGWVDPDGDPVYVQSAVTDPAVASVAATPDGRVVVQHNDPGATAGGSFAITVTVADALGATASKVLNVAVLGATQLATQSFVVTTTAGVPLAVNLTDHVTGAQGPVVLSDVSLPPTDDATVSSTSGTAGFRIAAPTAGTRFVDYTVTDGLSQVDGVVRVDVVAPEDEKLTAAPVTAFVRAKEDTTVDVLSAVTNPGGYVLLLDDVDWVPSGSSELAVDLVGQSLLRISGSTADGQPGTLGTVTYRATDGSGSAQRSVTGEVTVVLLGADVPPPPLAVDDAVTVRVGEQADIPVLANDIAPAGHVIALDPSAVVADPSAGLVFPSGRSIRYLAPDVPGVYQVTYGSYVLGYPSQADTATLLITVLDTSTNAPPTPPGLTGRVLSGASITIGFSGTGIDPDGDSVALDAIATQPDTGSATVSADGSGIVYTSAPGFSGQVSFTYQVVDARGATATGTVSVGVLDAERDPSPVTYSDYVQVQVGPDQRVVVEPMANDIDLTGGSLELVDVTADARAGTPEYAALEAQIESVDNGTVTIKVGQDPATSAYVYTVRNAGGSTSVGRIVVKAVRERVLDLPVVADTILTAETAEGFTAGVDVVADSVSWATGDVSGLRLSLWGNPAGVRSSGWVISGRVTDAPQLIAFELAGTNFAGEEVSTYGFLRVPGAAETRLALRTSYTAAQVNEDESVDIDLADIMVVPEGDSLVLDTSALRTGGARAAATCTAVQGTTVRYAAGKGAPYTDSCTVSVRLASQKTVTVIPVPVVIVPLQAQPTLLAAALTVSPGATATFDLSKMVSWPKGAQTRPVTYATAYRGDQFTVTQTGATVTVVAADTALPGKVEPVTVSLTSDPDTPVVSLSLEVGPAPSELPKGATVSQQCSQASGSSCTITVVGKSGEVNPLPKSPLVVTAVQQSAACPAVTFAVASTGAVTASWPADSAGVVCTTVFAVTDAQGRVSSGDRMGVINLDLQGLPADPQQIKQTAFGDGSLSVAVVGGEAAKSYPAVQGFRVYVGKQVVTTCTAAGSCPEITGLTNGSKQEYTVKAFNAVGESRGQAATQAWSYAVPRTPTLAATPVPHGADGRAATIVVSGLDSSTSKIALASAAGTSREVVTNGAPSVTVDGFDVGSNTATTVSVTPFTKFDLPPVAGANAAGGAATVVTNGIGAPGLAADDRMASYTFSADRRRATATLEVQATANGDGSEVLVGLWVGGRCTSTVTASGGRATVTISDLRVNRTSTHELCAYSQRDGVVFAQAPTVRITLRSWQDPGAPAVLSGYQVAAGCSPFGAGCAAAQVLQPSVDVPDDATVQFSMDGGGSWRSDVALEVGVPTSVIARYCVDLGGGEQRCSTATSPVPAADETRQYRVGVSAVQCTVGEQPTVTVAGPESDSSVAWTLLDVNGDETTDLTAMVQARVTVTWNGRVSGVQPWKATQTCAVPPPADPGG